MRHMIQLRRPEAALGEPQEERVELEIGDFDLYGRHHEVRSATAEVSVTRLAQGVYLDLTVLCEIRTLCDRTLEPTVFEARFGDSEYVSRPNDPELYIRDWELDLQEYAERILPTEIPMQVFAPGTEPVGRDRDEDEIDPRWRGLRDIAAGF
ncbi:hypothetical protein E0L93_07950 [Rubrobacter taiwanensis]|jgi:uncharacterized protein|uniref:DUF177 domain-containing protein n=1 Tax=Rubrobacter taiwanensis TaxID=185139 RepID=A0A4R1BHD7_9ACTN|nr:hypothetical protein [Rubrobacter taiwanensis]TCJ16660.1 hypothetical protein E0L93_07950 [Rubrobacter taiwanensis]